MQTRCLGHWYVFSIMFYIFHAFLTWYFSRSATTPPFLMLLPPASNLSVPKRCANNLFVLSGYVFPLYFCLFSCLTNLQMSQATKPCWSILESRNTMGGRYQGTFRNWQTGLTLGNDSARLVQTDTPTLYQAQTMLLT